MFNIIDSKKCKSAHIRIPKNGTLGARTEILRPLLLAKHPPKMMELPLVLSLFPLLDGFKPIFEYCHFSILQVSGDAFLDALASLRSKLRSIE